jgi:serine/tyrosine/threonine adenylyltransferase
LPGAVLTRVASSHLRVGTFEYFGRRGDADSVRLLTDYALERHYPTRQNTEFAPLALFDAVLEAQATLIAKWMNLGFVHGVMNTDNCSIAGETIDYGPCAFLDTYDPERTFSSIDHAGRYAYVNQPKIGRWNLARLAEAFLPLFGEVTPAVVSQLEARLARFMPLFDQQYGSGLCAKIGLEHSPENVAFGRSLLDLMRRGRVDFTLAFRRLVALAADSTDTFSELFGDQPITAWVLEWRQRAQARGGFSLEVCEGMRLANPAFIPRNHRVEEAIAAAIEGDLGPFERLRRALAEPFREQPEFEFLTQAPGDEQFEYATFCGT